MLPSLPGYDDWKNDYDEDEDGDGVKGDPDFYWDEDDR